MRPLVPAMRLLLDDRVRIPKSSRLRGSAQIACVAGLEAGPVARAEAARVAQRRAPPRAAAGVRRVARAARVETQPGDDDVGVTAVGVDGDPLALARLAPRE